MQSIPNHTQNTISELDPEACVFVSANAGAGKTTLLTSRVLSLLLHGVEPARILCLTFTNAAAAEMKHRILKALGEWVMADEETLRAKVSSLTRTTNPGSHVLARARSLFANVLEAPEGIRMQTLHGFCQSLLRRFPLEAGVSPHFTVMDSRSEQEAMHEAKQRLLTHVREQDPAIQQILDHLARSTTEHAFNDLLEQIVKQKRQFRTALDHPVPEGLKTRIYRAFQLPMDSNEQNIIAQALRYTPEQLSTLREATRYLQDSDKKSDQTLFAMLARWLEAPDAQHTMLSEYSSLMLTGEGAPRKTLFTKFLKDEKLAQALRDEQERIYQLHRKLLTLRCAEHSVRVTLIAEALIAQYDAIKRTHGWMDYDDLILKSCALLNVQDMTPWVLFKLDGGIDHILVDEAQDTSPEQWSIVQALTQEFFAGEGAKQAQVARSVFIVGDEKQSIFSFQGADVQELGRMQRYFARAIDDAGKTWLNLALTKSYRSTDEVLQAVDSIFADPQTRKGLTFGDTPLTHIPTRSGKPGLVEMWPLFSPQDASEENPNPRSPRFMLAEHIAHTIRGWLDRGEAKPDDIMVLVRTRSSFVDKLVRLLKRYDIPVAGHDRMQLGDNLAVQDLIALGQVLLLPDDDLTLAALLKSPIGNLSEEELFTLAHGRGKQSLWERLRDAATGGDTAFTPIYEMLATLRTKADMVLPYELYTYALDMLSGRARLTGRMGEEYADPIDEFLSQVLLYERGHAASLQGFIQWITHSKSEIKRDMEQAKACVRIMTVHGSKGLQAKYVIMPDTVGVPSSKEHVLWQTENHSVLPICAPSSKERDELANKLWAERKEREMAEYRRLLYVALTRAEDRLYVCGAEGDKKASEGCWYELIRKGLEPIATALENGTLRLGTPPVASPATTAHATPAKLDDTAQRFNFLKHAAASEPSPSKPLTPSRMAATQPASSSPLKANQAYMLGNMVHQLLQYIPTVAPTERHAAAQRLATLHSAGLSEAEREQATAQAMAVIEHPQFAFLFDAQAMAEVPVAGVVNVGGRGVAISGQIDRLRVDENDVWIVDFKSQHIPPAATADTPQAYIRQLALYQALLREVYPAKTVHCALLWTSAAKLVPIAQPLLDESLSSSYI
jgi:ATP-dependent helicase/nuclease subunit A